MAKPVTLTFRNLTERDLHIFKTLIEKELKRIKKLAQQERQHFGKGFAFDELEDYMDLMLKDINEVLELPEIKEEFNKRINRITRKTGEGVNEKY